MMADMEEMSKPKLWRDDQRLVNVIVHSRGLHSQHSTHRGYGSQEVDIIDLGGSVLNA